jgi:hypothetical protein
MPKSVRSLALLAFACVLSAMPAQAQSRVFVAAQGSDSNPCTFAAPCRTFQHAHDTVAANGEIDVLDPAGYGVVTISKALSIQGHGYAGIAVDSGNTGITINAGPADAVNLNGLLIDGNSVGAVGVQFNSGKGLVVEGCVIRNMGGGALTAGLLFSSSATTLQILSVSNSYFTDNNGFGIDVRTQSSGPITAAIERSGFFGNFVGVEVNGRSGTGAINAAVTDSAVGNSGGDGVEVQSLMDHSVATAALTRTTVSGNLLGVRAFNANATLRLTQSTVTGNTIGYEVSAAVIFSYSDNVIDDNGSNSGTLTAASKQ